MNSKEFRKAGKDVIDWIADYYEKISEFPVMSQVKANAIRDDLPNDIPIEGESFECIMKDLEDIILPGISHWQSPNFYGFFLIEIANIPRSIGKSIVGKKAIAVIKLGKVN